MKIVGITGGMGSGKTTVLKMFEKLGVSTYIADIEAKRLMLESPSLKEKICSEFGMEAYLNGELNRAFLANIIFKDAEKLKVLNSYVHPEVRADFNRFVKNANGDYVLYESALLFQSETNTVYDFIILVRAPYETRLNRILSRDDTTEVAVKNRLKHQKISDDSLEKVDFFIDNLSLIDTESQVLKIHEHIISEM